MSLFSRFTSLFESRATLKTPTDWLKKAFGVTDGPTGLTVNANTVTRSAAVYACCRVIAETVASLPVKVYQRRDDGGKDPKPGHPLWRILHDAPNAEMDSFAFIEGMMWQVLLRGNHYSEIIRMGSGSIGELMPFDTAKCNLDRTESGRLFLLVEGDKTYPYEKILHIPGIQMGQSIEGVSPIKHARLAIEMGMAADEYAARFWGNASVPSALVTYPGARSDDERKALKDRIEQGFKAMKDKHRIAVMPDGVTWTSMTIPNKDAEFLETRKFQVTEIARIFRVPPHMIADLERATFSNVEQQSIDFVVHTIRPWLVRIERALKRQLFRGDTLFAEFLVDGLLRGDIKSRFDSYAVARQNGILNGDEIRELENRNPTEDGSGQLYWMPSNMMTVDSSQGEPTQTNQGDVNNEQKAARETVLSS